MVLEVCGGKFIFGLDGNERKHSQLVVFLKKSNQNATLFFPLRRFVQVVTTKGSGYLQD